MKSLSSSAWLLRAWVVTLAPLALTLSCTPDLEEDDGGEIIIQSDRDAALAPDSGADLDAAVPDSAPPPDAALPPDAAMPPPTDAGPDPIPLTREARVYFDLFVRPVLLNEANLCVNCHTYNYGYARNINFLEVEPGQPVYEGVINWRRADGQPLYNTNSPEATMTQRSPLFSRGQHGFSGVAPPFPVGSLGVALEWLKKERNACRQREAVYPARPELHCIPEPDGGVFVRDAGLSFRDQALIEFETYVKPMIAVRGCATCHAGTGAFAGQNINFLNTFPTPPTQYDSILAYKLTGGVPFLFNFNTLTSSPILAKGAHAGPALAPGQIDRATVLRWLDLEKKAACEEGTFDCGAPPPIPDAGTPDTAVNTPVDAGIDVEIPDAGPLSPVEISRNYYYANVSNVLAAQGCIYCHAGPAFAALGVNYMDHLGEGLEYESVVEYVSTSFRQLYDVSNPAMSLMLTKGVHSGDAYGRPESLQQDIENFKTWVMLENQAQQVFITDAGVRPDAARPPLPDAAINRPDAAGRDAALTPREVAENYFYDNIYPHLESKSCVACHSGSLSRTYAPPVNWLDVDNQGPYRSALDWRTAGGYGLLDFEEPQYSLLVLKPRHYNNIAPAYLNANDGMVSMMKFITWVTLERTAAIAEGTYAPPMPDAGSRLDAAMGMPDAARPDAAGLDGGAECRPDASASRAAAREYFLSHVYNNLSTTTRPEATCQGCHVQGNRPTPFMIRPGESADLAEQRYQFIRNNNNLVNKQVPTASLFLIKDENHEGGQGLLKPTSREVDRTFFINWVNMEKAVDDEENCRVGGSVTASACETQFLPNVPPAGASFPEETMIDLADKLCRDELAGAAASVQATRFGTGLEFSYLTVFTPPGKALRVTAPLLTRWTSSTTADGGIRYFPAEIVNVNPSFNRLIPGGSSVRVTTTPGTIMSNFFNGTQIPDAGGLSSYLSIDFQFIGEEAVVDAGTPQDAGPVPLVPCTDVNTFATQVRPRLMQNFADGGGASCMTCHAGGTGYARSTAAMDLRMLSSNPPDQACAQVKQWVNPTSPQNSVLFVNVDPGTGPNTAHPYYLNTSDFQTFRTALTPWIQSEAQ